jgi:CDP-glucose 4,6-dehydratase
VIGGGDFAADRLVPDFVRAALEERGARASGGSAVPAISLRYPDAVRPWQHVLEPLAGYLMLAEKLHGDARAFSTAFNFGPDKDDFRPVRELAEGICAALGTRWEQESAPQPHEAGLLRLDSTRAEKMLDWVPRLAFDDTLRWTSEWYAQWLDGADPRTLTLGQIRKYQTLAPAFQTPRP